MASRQFIFTCTLIQCPKLTFLGRHQLATEIYFSVSRWKNVVAKKVLIKFFFCSKTQIDGKFWSPTFLLRIRMKFRVWGRNGDFSAIDLIQPSWLFIHLGLKMPAIHVYIQFCTPTEKLSFGLFFRVVSRRSTDHHVAGTWPQPCSISHSSPLDCPQYICYGKPLKKTRQGLKLHTDCYYLCSCEKLW